MNIKRVSFQIYLVLILFVYCILSTYNHTLAYSIDLTVEGSDAIFLAGRTDVLPVPPANGNPNAFILKRHGFITPENILETMPSFISVTGGSVIKVAGPATGSVSFFNGFGGIVFGPGGNGTSGSNLTSLGGISGYTGPQGPLTGIFLDDSIPNSGLAPETLNFNPGGLGTNFISLSPELRQIFYIGDGLTNSNIYQEFYAPIGATRLFLGIPDGWGFNGVPGFYEDNDGAYRVSLNIQNPQVPEPSTIILLGSTLMGMGFGLRKKFKR